MSYDTEFGSEYAIETPIVEWFAANGWDDCSWHNNICPSFQKENPGTRGDPIAEVFVDALEPEERECGPGPRFFVHGYGEDGERDNEGDREFHTFAEVKAHLEALT